MVEAMQWRPPGTESLRCALTLTRPHVRTPSLSHTTALQCSTQHVTRTPDRRRPLGAISQRASPHVAHAITPKVANGTRNPSPIFHGYTPVLPPRATGASTVRWRRRRSRSTSTRSSRFERALTPRPSSGESSHALRSSASLSAAPAALHLPLASSPKPSQRLTDLYPWTFWAGLCARRCSSSFLSMPEDMLPSWPATRRALPQRVN